MSFWMKVPIFISICLYNAHIIIIIIIIIRNEYDYGGVMSEDC